MTNDSSRPLVFINFDLKAYAPKSNKTFQNANETTTTTTTNSSSEQQKEPLIKQIKYSSILGGADSQQQHIVSFEPDMLVFEVDGSGSNQGMSRKLKMKNSSNNYLTYKIKVTSPEKFRVNSHIGLIEPMGTSEINIKVANDFAKSFNQMLTNERFIVLSKPIGREEIVDNLRDYWSTLSSSSPGVRQNNIKCVIRKKPPAIVSRQETLDLAASSQTAQDQPMANSADDQQLKPDLENAQKKLVFMAYSQTILIFILILINLFQILLKP